MRNLKNIRREGGFTLVELLVVVVITVALAAIAVPLYLNQANKADEASAKSSLSAASAFLAAAIADGQTVTGSVGGELSTDLGKISTSGMTGAFVVADGTYCLTTGIKAGEGAAVPGWFVDQDNRVPAVDADGTACDA